MSLFIASLNSGSNGNCYYIANDKAAILIDAGISCKETEKRMHRLGLSMQNVRAIFISHEHSDHIRGLNSIGRKYHIPVYITPKTMAHGRLWVRPEMLRSFTAHEEVHIEGLSIMAFPKYHDAIDPHSFTITGNGVTIGVFTDIGAPCEQLIHHFKQCHAAFLEANYDTVMLDTGRYPIFLKNRIRGGQGHLSNHQALDLFKAHRPDHMSHLLLSHLSKDNNCPELATALFKAHALHTHVAVASRYEPSDVYKVSPLPASSQGVGVTTPATLYRKAAKHALQASLF